MHWCTLCFVQHGKWISCDVKTGKHINCTPVSLDFLYGSIWLSWTKILSSFQLKAAGRYKAESFKTYFSILTDCKWWCMQCFYAWIYSQIKIFCKIGMKRHSNSKLKMTSILSSKCNESSMTPFNAFVRHSF